MTNILQETRNVSKRLLNILVDHTYIQTENILIRFYFISGQKWDVNVTVVDIIAICLERDSGLRRWLIR